MVDALLCSRLPGLINVRDDPTAPFCARFKASLMCESAYTVNSEGLHSLCKMTPFNGKVRCKPDSATFACDGRPPSPPSSPPPGLSRASQGLSASPPSASPPFPSPPSPVRHRPPPCPPVAFGDERAAPPTPPSQPPPPPPSPCHDSATHTCAADVAAPQADYASIRSQPTIHLRTALLMSVYPASGKPVSKSPCAAVAASVLQQRLRPACD